jgi:FixJ family two-component response regulator
MVIFPQPSTPCKQARHFIQKPFNPDKFLASVQRAMRLAGERHARRMVDLKIRRLIEQLSAREQEVLHGLLDGRTSNEIAVALDISPRPSTSIGRM